MASATPLGQVNPNLRGNRMILNNIRYASLTTLALSLAACSGTGSNGATAISAAAASPPATSAMPQRPTGPVTPMVSPGTKAAEFVTGTLCTRPDQVVFSCPLEKTDKIVSICAAGNAAPHRFYYAFGKANAPELVYPPRLETGDELLNRTNLIFAGGTGGVAFSFHRSGFEYITFLISGKGFRNYGVMVRRDGMPRANLHLQCRSESIYETKNNSLYREVFDLKPDKDLKYGLPYYPAKESQ